MQHPSFTLVAFDVLARHNALQAIYLHAGMINASAVSRDLILNTYSVKSKG